MRFVFSLKKQIVGLIHVIRCGKQQVVALVGNVNVCAGTNVRAVMDFSTHVLKGWYNRPSAEPGLP